MGGLRVFHVRFGEGELIRIEPGRRGPVAVVAFPYARLSIPTAELIERVSGRPLAASRETEQEVELPALPCVESRLRDARQGILALRLGQVSERQVEELSVGLDGVRSTFKRAIDSALAGRPRVLLIEGPWGAGKTHALTLLQAMAHLAGLATAMVVLDGHDITLRNPNRLYSAVFNNIRYPRASTPQSVADKLHEAKKAATVWRLREVGADRLAEVLEAVSVEQLEDPDYCHVLEDYLAGELSASQAEQALWPARRLPRIAARDVASRSARFVSLLEEWSRFMKLTGDGGLVVILDEVDVEYAYIPWQWRDRRNELLAQLRTLSSSNSPLLIAFGSAPSGAAMPPADDPVKDIQTRLANIVTSVTVPSPGEAELRELFQRIVRMYADAYPNDAGVQNAARLVRILDGILKEYQKHSGAVPRFMVRKSIEFLDVLSTAGQMHT